MSPVEWGVALLISFGLQWGAGRMVAWRWNALRPLIRAIGLTRLSGDGYTGWYGSLPVDLAIPSEAKDLRLTVTVYGLAPGLVLRGLARGGATGTATGDLRFDEAVEVGGPHPLVRAVLNAETRAGLRRLMDRPAWPLLSCEVADRSLRAVLAPFRRKHLDRYVSVLREVMKTAQRLVAPEDVPAQLAANVSTDPQPRFRLKSLETLVRAFPDHPAVAEAIAAARADPNDDVRLGAGLAQGPAGLDLVREIAQAEDTDDAAAARAVVALGPELTPERVREMLGRALRRRRVRTAEAFLAWLGGYGGGESVAALAKVLAIEPGELAVAAAGALGATGLPAAEAPLVRALENANPDVRLAAAEALEAVGTAAAVLPLKAATGDPVLERAARHALAAIQSRLTGTPGELSLAGGEEGQLTLSDGDASGRLTLTPPAPAKTEA